MLAGFMGKFRNAFPMKTVYFPSVCLIIKSSSIFHKEPMQKQQWIQTP